MVAIDQWCFHKIKQVKFSFNSCGKKFLVSHKNYSWLELSIFLYIAMRPILKFCCIRSTKTNHLFCWSWVTAMWTKNQKQFLVLHVSHWESGAHRIMAAVQGKGQLEQCSQIKWAGWGFVGPAPSLFNKPALCSRHGTSVCVVQLLWLIQTLHLSYKWVSGCSVQDGQQNGQNCKLLPSANGN